MPQYLVKAPCAHANADGTSTAHNAPGAIVDIPADVAAQLGDAVQPVGGVAAPDRFAATAFPDPTVTVDGVDQGRPRRGRRGADTDPGEVVEPSDG